ncbi:MAG: amidohydrolase family protein [Candidatus Binatia bacterium]
MRRAISLGLPPIQAIQSVTLNPAAIYSGLEQDIGGIAPGRLADFVILESLEDCFVEEVLIGGKRIAKNGRSLVKTSPIELPADLMGSLRFSFRIIRESFKIAAPDATPRIRVMGLVNLTITEEEFLTLSRKQDLWRQIFGVIYSR